MAEITLRDDAINAFLSDPSGPVGSWLDAVLDDAHRRVEHAAPEGDLVKYREEQSAGIDSEPPGRLKESITRTSVLSEAGRIWGSVYADETIAPHAIFVVSGTRSHPIKSRGRWPLRFAVAPGYEIVVTPSVRHPGTQAQPFIREAVEEAVRDAL
jgi:hypothetical protein